MDSRRTTVSSPAGLGIQFDEVFFSLGGTSSRSGDQVIKAMRPSLNQFGKQKLMLFPSSPWTRTGLAYQMYVQGRMLMDEYLALQGKQDNARNRSEAMDEVDEQGEAMVADPTIFVAQLESWKLYEHSTDESFVPTYHQGWSPKHIIAKDEHGNTYELDADTNASKGNYIYVHDKDMVKLKHVDGTEGE